MLFVYDDFLLQCMLVVDDIYFAAHHDDPDVIYSVSLHGRFWHLPMLNYTH